MSYRAQVNDTPQQLAYGFQQEAMTLTNVGNNTAYLAEDSGVTAGLDLVLDVGGSITIDPEQTLWGICASNLSTQLSIVKSVGQRFAYASQSVKILSQVTRTNLGPGSGSGVQYNLSIPFDNTLSTQFAAIGVFVTSGSATAASYSFTWVNYLVTLGNTIQEAPKTVYERNAGTQLSLGAIFPVQAFGGQVTVAPNVAVTGTVTITVIGYNTAPTYPIPYGDPYKMTNGVGYEQFNHGGTYSYRAASLAASTTLDVPLPATTGPISVTVAYSQNAAGNVTVTPYIITTSNALTWTENTTQFDATTTTTGSTIPQFIKYNFPFYPPAYGFIRIVTPAGVTLSTIVVTTSTPNQ